MSEDNEANEANEVNKANYANYANYAENGKQKESSSENVLPEITSTAFLEKILANKQNLQDRDKELETILFAAAALNALLTLEDLSAKLTEKAWRIAAKMVDDRPLA